MGKGLNCLSVLNLHNPLQTFDPVPLAILKREWTQNISCFCTFFGKHQNKWYVSNSINEWPLYLLTKFGASLKSIKIQVTGDEFVKELFLATQIPVRNMLINVLWLFEGSLSLDFLQSGWAIRKQITKTFTINFNFENSLPIKLLFWILG